MFCVCRLRWGRSLFEDYFLEVVAAGLFAEWFALDVGGEEFVGGVVGAAESEEGDAVDGGLAVWVFGCGFLGGCHDNPVFRVCRATLVRKQ